MPDAPLFSVAIPNFNYADYLGETITSVLDQERGDVEIHVSDNASTDRSREIVSAFHDRNVRLSVNRTNVGFAGNLDRAAAPTTGRFVILLSSDDLMLSSALDTYGRFIDAAGASADEVVVTSSHQLIDATGTVYGRIGPQPKMWRDTDVDVGLSELLGDRVLRVAGSELLRRSMLAMRNPLPFLSTAFPRRLYDRVEGYGGSRLINPDKWFHWRLVAAATSVVFIDTELFAYRTHGGNQASQQKSQGALKHLVDEYTYTFEVTDEMLTVAGLSRDDLVDAYLRNDIIERGFAALLGGDHVQARRTSNFGVAVYPRAARRLWRLWLLRAVTAMGPFGGAPAKAVGGLVLKRRADDGFKVGVERPPPR